MTATAHLRCLLAVVSRDAVRFAHQRARLLAALVRPLLWLIVFAAGLRGLLEVPGMPPYGRAVGYEVYIIPGLVGMVQLFNGMQSSLSMVYDREMGSMRLMLTSPLPRWWLLLCKLAAGCAISIAQVYAFLAIAALWVGGPAPWGYLAVLPVLVLSGLMLGALGLFLSSVIRQLENFAGVMNFVIFPMFFLSSALYPLERMAESSAVLWAISRANPFTHAVEAIRFGLHGTVNWPALGWTGLALAVFFGLAVLGYDARRSAMGTKA